MGGLLSVASAVNGVLPVPASATSHLELQGALTLGDGADFLFPVVSDGKHAYFGTATDPVQVVKVDLATMSRVGALTLDLGEEEYLFSAVIDSDGKHAYFGTDTSPGRVVKVDLETMAQVEAVTLEPGENFLVSAVIDSDGTYAYFGTDTSPGRVVKVDLATMTRVDALTLNSGESGLYSAVSDGTYAYFGTYTSPGRVVKVNLATMTRAATQVAVQAGDGQSATVGASVPVAPSVIVRDASDAPVAGVSVTFVVASGGGSVTGAVAITDGSGVATVGSWTLGAMAGVNTLTAMITGSDPVIATTFTATGTAAAATQVESEPVSLLVASCDAVLVQVGQSVSCTVTGGDPGIEILWRAAYNPVFAEAEVTLDASGSGTFSFVVPAAALGQELTVELVDWLAPFSLGSVAGPVPSSVPSGGGPVPVWSLVMLGLAGGLVRRVSTVSVRG